MATSGLHGNTYGEPEVVLQKIFKSDLFKRDSYGVNALVVGSAPP